MRKPRPNLIWPLIIGGSVVFILFPFFLTHLFYELGATIFLNIIISIIVSFIFVLSGCTLAYLNFLWCKNVDLYFYREDEVNNK